MKLPTKKTKTILTLDKCIWWIYGAPGIGKTTFANSFGNVLFLHDDPGTRRVDAYKVRCSNWKNCLDAVELLEDDNELYDFIAIDKIEVMYMHCLRWFCKKSGVKHISDLKWSKGYDMVRLDFNAWLLSLTGLGKGIMFLSDYKTFKIEDDNKEVDKLVPSMKPAGMEIVSPLCDIIGYMGVRKSEKEDARIIYFKPTMARTGKDRDGKLPSKVLIGKEEQDRGLKKIKRKMKTLKKKRSK